MSSIAAHEILFVNHFGDKPEDLAADFVSCSADDELKKSDYAVVAFHFDEASEAITFTKKLSRTSGDSQKLVSTTRLSREDLRALYEAGDGRVQICDFAADDIAAHAREALTRFHARMNSSDGGKKSIERSQKRLVNTKKQVEALHKALLAVHSAQSVAEIETLLYSALAKILDLSWARVFLHNDEHLDSQLDRIRDQTLFKANLQLSSRRLGRIVFARNSSKTFNKGEEEALQQIVESVVLALDRLAKLTQAETLKFQWDSTFDAISEPLCLTDENFNILRTNRAFLETTKLKLGQVMGTNCFSTFCGSSDTAPISSVIDSSVVDGAPVSPKFIVQRSPKPKDEPHSYEVTTQKIRAAKSAEPILLILFRDITEQKRIEKQIFESAKMAELGTIGSSIAHDINNPLGGILSFLQLIKMDLPGDDSVRDDILEMEKAGHRCKEIVENLLKFSRRQEAGVPEPINMNEVVDQALKVTELQTRSLGVTVEVKTSRPEQILMGHFNILSQALSHILQNAFDAVAERLSQNPGYKGKVTIDVSHSTEGLVLTITDNGIGISPELQNKILNPLFSTKTKSQGLGLTLAYQIVDEHGGRLEIFSRPNVGTAVKISFINV